MEILRLLQRPPAAAERPADPGVGVGVCERVCVRECAHGTPGICLPSGDEPSTFQNKILLIFNTKLKPLLLVK